jgi:amino acid transporter
MASSGGPVPSAGSVAQRLVRPAQVLIVSSIMLTFISYWRTAAVVLCDLGSTAYYIGGIVEQAIGPAAPWFILAVMLFSYAVRSVYIESCALFVRGGVYRVVKEAMGGFLAKLSVSALMFDYILTGPISGVSAGAYLMGLLIDLLEKANPTLFHALALDTDFRKTAINGGAALFACLITLYFFRKNLIGIHESSDKAMKIMIATTIMAVIILGWCGLTLAIQGPKNSVPAEPTLNPKFNYDSGEVQDPLGFISNTGLGQRLRDLGRVKWVAAGEGTITVETRDGRKQELPLSEKVTVRAGGKEAELTDLQPGTAVVLAADDKGIFRIETASSDSVSWLGIIGLIGLFIAFGHSILAMSGEETLAQVYREVESPKLPNFKRAAFIVFLYSLLFTASISFLAVLLIPDAERMPKYSSNLIGGLAMNMWSPAWAHGWPPLILNAFVVVVGFLILGGAVNTAIIGSNGVLNRVAEDGVMPDWFLKPHPRYGTTYRLLYLVVGLQLATILISGGNVITLGEAYAFGVVWSFVFKALAMVVLRFKDHTPRPYRVPLNVKVGNLELPIGLGLIFLVLLAAAIMNLLTKETATIWGLSFTTAFLTVFLVTEHFHEKRRGTAKHQHLEQFNQQTAEAVTAEQLGLRRTYRKLVAIRSPQNLFMLEKALAETDPVTTDVVVMTAKVAPLGDTPIGGADLDNYDQKLMTAVVDQAERAGKEVKPMIVPTNNPLHAVLKTAMELNVNELIMGASNKHTADEQLEQLAFYWISLHGGEPAPLTVRILNRERDMYLDLAGGNRIPKFSERQARTVAELRAAGVGVDRVLLLHDGSRATSDLFQAVLTMLDPQVLLGVLPVGHGHSDPGNGQILIEQDRERAASLGRQLQLLPVKADSGADIVRVAQEGQYDLIILALPPERPSAAAALLDERTDHVLRRAHCRVFLAAAPIIPDEVVDINPSAPS